jgi:hypothetical protein
MCCMNYFRKSYHYEIKRKNTVEAGMQAIDDNVIRRRKDEICSRITKARIQALILFETYCFPAVSKSKGNRLSLMLYLSCFSCV